MTAQAPQLKLQPFRDVHRVQMLQVVGEPYPNAQISGE